MSGHSKWSNNKHKKKIKDKQKSKIFTKMTKNIFIAMQQGSSNPDQNFKLRYAINNALSKNVKRDLINKIILKEKNSFIQKNIFIYESYIPGGIAIIIECLSDNKNRTISYIRHAFSKVGILFKKNISVSYMFKKVLVLSFIKISHTKKKIIAIASQYKTEKIKILNDEIIIYIKLDIKSDLQSKLKKHNLTPNTIKIISLPINNIYIQNNENKTRLLNLINILQSYKDVQNIYHNAILKII